MNTEKDNQVNKVLASLEGMHRAEANPYLYEKIRLKMSNPAYTHISRKMSIAGIGMLVLLVSLNSFAAWYNLRSSQMKQKDSVYLSLGNEMGFGNSYNY